MKRSVQRVTTLLLAAALPLVLAGCGSKDGDDDKVVVEMQKTPDQAPPPAATPPPAAETPPAAEDDTTIADPIVGLFEQFDNRQAKIQITDVLLVNTNLVIPSPAGDGTRLSPKFPHALVFDAATGIYKTTGFFNDATSVFRNVELRLRLYNSDTLLDVTLAVPGSGTNPTPGPGPGPGPNPNPCFDPCCPPPPCCMPPPPCCQPPTCPNGPGGDGNAQPLLYQYRYERVVSVDDTASL